VYLSPPQADGLLEAAKADQNGQIYPFILIGLRTGNDTNKGRRYQQQYHQLDADTGSAARYPKPPQNTPKNQNLMDNQNITGAIA